MAQKTKVQLQEENEQLKNSLSEMQKQMEQLQKMMQGVMDAKSVTPFAMQQPQSDRIPLDEMIPVTSAFEGILVLVPEPQNPDNEYRFTEFGETIDIPMDDLTKIVKNYKTTYCKSGYFIVQDERAVKQLRLKSNYDKLVTDEEIDKIINLDAESFNQRYDELTERQQETLVDRVISRKFKWNDVSIEILYALGKKINKSLIDLENPLERK